MSGIHSDAPTPPPPGLDAPLFALDISPRGLLGLAWLCEQAARCCEWDGDPALGMLLRQDPARFRARVVNQ